MKRSCLLCLAVALGSMAVSSSGAVVCDEQPFYGSPPVVKTPRTREVPLLLTNCGYVVGYSDARRNPLWVAYHLKAVGKVGDKADNPERKNNFRTDPRTRAKVGKDAFAFSVTGCDRGHMAPSYGIGSRYGKEAQDETFFMSNMSPQKAALNQRTWKLLEEVEANTFANGCEEVWIITGPIFDGPRKVIRKSGVEIPSAFFKIVIDELKGKPRVLAYRMEQSTVPTRLLDQFLTSVRSIERATGLDFLTDLPDALEEKLETAKPAKAWAIR